VDGVLEL